MRMASPLSRFVVPSVLLASLGAGGATCGTSSSTPDGGEPPVRTVVEATTPVGSVAGEVREFDTGAPAATVKVSLQSGAFKRDFDTPVDGMFTFQDVPAGGAVRVTMSREGYLGAGVTTTLPVAAGNFPSGNNTAYVGPVHLLRAAPAEGQLKVQLLLSDGTAAAGARVFFDLPAAFMVTDTDGRPAARGQVHQEVTAMDGSATFSAMPELGQLASRFPTMPLTVTVPAFGGPTAAGTPTSNGTVVNFTLGDLAAGARQRIIVLPRFDANVSLKIVASSAPDLVDGPLQRFPGYVLSEGTISVYFNTPVLGHTVSAQLVGENGAPPNINGPPSFLDLEDFATPPGVPSGPIYGVKVKLPVLTDVAESNLYLVASPATGGAAYGRAAALYIQQPTDSPRVVSMRQVEVVTADSAISQGEQVALTLSHPVGGRAADGTAVASSNFRPILVNLSFNNQDFYVDARLAEPAPGAPYVAGGYTTQVQFACPTTIARGTSLTVDVQFNDSGIRDGGTSRGGSETAYFPDGTVADLLQGNAIVPTFHPSEPP